MDDPSTEYSVMSGWVDELNEGYVWGGEWMRHDEWERCFTLVAH